MYKAERFKSSFDLAKWLNDNGKMIGDISQIFHWGNGVYVILYFDVTEQNRASIIKNMDLPYNCQSCKFKLESNRCQFTYDIVADNVDKRRYNCPLESFEGEDGGEADNE